MSAVFKKWYGGILVALLCGAAVAGCGSNGGTSSGNKPAASGGGNSNPSFSPTAPSAAVKPMALPKKTIGILAVALADSGSKADVENYKSIFSKLGWDTVVVDGQGVPST